MARQTGIIQLSGTLGGISFYRHKKYGMLARACNPVSAQRIAKDPAFARTRENGTEFGMVSRAGKLLRDGLKGFLRDVPSDELDLRVMRKLMEIKALDTVNARGQRRIGMALQLHPESLGRLTLSNSYGLDRFLTRPPVVNRQEGTITLQEIFHPIPGQATHAIVTGFRGRIDFVLSADTCGVPGTFEPVASEAVTIPLATPLSLPSQGRGGRQLLAQDIVLTIPKPAGDGGIEVWGMKVVFYQEVNGVKHNLSMGAAELLMSNTPAPDSEVLSLQHGITTDSYVSDRPISLYKTIALGEIFTTQKTVTGDPDPEDT